MESYETPLTPREQELIALVREGVTGDKEMAARMGLTTGSVKEYLHRLYGRLRLAGWNVKGRTDLAVWAFRPEVMQKRNGNGGLK